MPTRSSNINFEPSIRLAKEICDDLKQSGVDTRIVRAAHAGLHELSQSCLVPLQDEIEILTTADCEQSDEHASLANRIADLNANAGEGFRDALRLFLLSLPPEALSEDQMGRLVGRLFELLMATAFIGAVRADSDEHVVEGRAQFLATNAFATFTKLHGLQKELTANRAKGGHAKKIFDTAENVELLRSEVRSYFEKCNADGEKPKKGKAYIYIRRQLLHDETLNHGKPVSTQTIKREIDRLGLWTNAEH